jgi:hypothetical protein
MIGVRARLKEGVSHPGVAQQTETRRSGFGREDINSGEGYLANVLALWPTPIVQKAVYPVIFVFSDRASFSNAARTRRVEGHEALG